MSIIKASSEIKFRTSFFLHCAKALIAFNLRTSLILRCAKALVALACSGGVL